MSKPLVTGLALRDKVADGYQQRMGLDRRSAEDLAKSDLEIVDRAALGADPTAKPKRKKPERVAQSVQDEAALAGLTLSQAVPGEAAGRRERPDVLYAQAHKLGEKYSHMVARIFRILENGDTTSAKHLSDITKDSAVPKLAQEYAEVWANFLLRRGGDGPTSRIGFNRGSFSPTTRTDDRDARRKFKRLCEDICDRSVKDLGPWWVK